MQAPVGGTRGAGTSLPSGRRGLVSVRLRRQRLGATMVRPCRVTRWFGILLHLRPKRGAMSSPNGIRTRVSTLRGWCPRPLDDGARHPFGPSQTIRSGEILVRVTPLVQGSKADADARTQTPRPENSSGSTGLGAHASGTTPHHANDEPGHTPEPHRSGARRGIWLGGEDSNPQLRDQNPLCCRLHHPRSGGFAG
jgi:hypothetical protein